MKRGGRVLFDYRARSINWVPGTNHPLCAWRRTGRLRVSGTLGPRCTWYISSNFVPGTIKPRCTWYKTAALYQVHSTNTKNRPHPCWVRPIIHFFPSTVQTGQWHNRAPAMLPPPAGSMFPSMIRSHLQRSELQAGVPVFSQRCLPR